MRESPPSKSKTNGNTAATEVNNKLVCIGLDVLKIVVSQLKIKKIHMSLVVVGSMAFDAIETPFGKSDKIIGGAATNAKSNG